MGYIKFGVAQPSTFGRLADLEILVPAYNEEARIEATLLAIVDGLIELGLPSRIRVIDNGSADRTADIVDRVADRSGTIDVTVEGCSAQGKGRAVARGMTTSLAHYVGFCDADLSTPVSAISEAVIHLKAGWPVVIGSRYLEGSSFIEEQPLLRRVGGKSFRLLTKGLVGGVADTQCGFKFFNGEAARRIFSNLQLSGFAFDVEVLARARQLGYGIKEFPVAWQNVEGSTFHPLRHGFEVSRDLWRIHRYNRSRVFAQA